jgi:hypothetical protein
VNRDLIASDLDRIASTLSPRIVSLLGLLIEAAIESLEESPELRVKVGPVSINAGPLVAKMARTQVSHRLPESVAPQLSAALRQMLELSDEDLVALCELAATELGAWAGVLEPLTDAELAGAADPLAKLASFYG